jgi:hypothetical protein
MKTKDFTRWILKNATVFKKKHSVTKDSSPRLFAPSFFLMNWVAKTLKAEALAHPECYISSC